MVGSNYAIFVIDNSVMIIRIIDIGNNNATNKNVIITAAINN